MGTQERKQRELEARERLFIETAEELIRTEGLLGLQMSRLAQSCDYATGTLYQHFHSKEDLLLAVAARTLGRRAAAFETIARLPLASRERMLAVLLADIDFSQRHPDHYQLMQYVTTEVVWQSASPHQRQLMVDAGAPISHAVAGIVDDAIAAGDLPAVPGLRSVEFALGPWCLNTGMHTLVHARGLLEAYAVRDAYSLLLYHGHALLNGLGWQPLLDIDDTSAVEDQSRRIGRVLEDHPETALAEPPH